MRKDILSILPVFMILFPALNSFPQESIRADILKYFPDLTSLEITEFEQNNMLENMPFAAGEFKLIPQIPQKAQIIAGIKNHKFNIATETVFYIPYTKNYNKASGNLDSFKILTNIEGLKGILYYSESKKKERVLFDKAEILSGKVAKDISVVPELHTITAQIEDSTFGDNKYKIDYNSDSNNITMKMSNTTRLSLAFIPVVGKGDLVFYLAAVPADNGIFLYCCGISKTVDSEYIKKRVATSVYNRVIALFDWFKNSYEK